MSHPLHAKHEALETKERVGESMRQDSWQNNAKLNAETMHSHAAVFTSGDKKVNEPNNRQNYLPCQATGYVLQSQFTQGK